MSASKTSIESGSASPTIGRDLAKVDAYENTAADYDEIPDITDEQMARAEHYRNGVHIPRRRGRPPIDGVSKEQVTLRLDRDVLDFYRAKGAGWQTKINAALRSLFEAK